MVYGEKKVSRVTHYISAILVCFGSWLSAYFIVATNAWMQHPVGYMLKGNGEIVHENFTELLTNPWLFGSFFHVVLGSLTPAAFL